MRRGARLTVSLVAVGALAACTSATPDAAGPSAVASSPAGVSPSAGRSAAGFSPGSASIGDSLFPKEGNGGYDVTHYDITISYDPVSTELTGRVKVAATATQGLSRFDLDLHGLTVNSVTVDGTAATFAHPGDKLQVTPATGVASGSAFTTEVDYGGKPTDYQDPMLGLEGFVPAADGAPGALAQGEPDVAASWFPVNDHPRDKATYDVTITTPSALAAISNGVLVSKTAAGGDTTWHWRESAPMASYLALVAIGKYRVHTSTHDGLPVVTAVDDTLPTSYDTQLARTPEVIDFLSGYFGPYPFDAEGGVIHADRRLNFALENQSRPAYAPGFFNDPNAAWVIAHEEAHQWFGDSVSVHDWKDLWLNEGFATYAEWLWSEHVGNGTPKQLFDQLYSGGKLPQGTPGSPDLRALFDDTVYQRGAATLEALRITIGDVAFFKILKGWAAEHRFGNASTEDFTAYAQRISGKDLTALFQAWLYTPGKPPYPKALS